MESQPLDVVEDILHIFIVLLAGVGVVEAQVAHAAVALGNAEVHADGFGMSYMQIAIRLWREASLYPSAVLTFGEVVLYHLLNETQTASLFRGVHFFLCHMLFFSFSIAKLHIFSDT